MQRFIITVSFMLSVACLVLAYRWVIVLEPADPLIPFILCILCGGLFVYAWQLLGEALDKKD